jgi:membrane protease YdiL (CAAX protease family)
LSDRRESPLRLWPRAAVVDGTLTLGRWPDLFLVTFVVLALPYLATVFVPLVAPLAHRLDPHDYWIQPTAHQLGSLLLTLVLMRLLSKRSWSQWGFNLQRAKQGLLLAALFAVLVTPVQYLLMDAQPAPTTSISTSQIVAVLLTHFFIIGFTQEVLFRAFAMGMLAQQWPKAAGLAAAVIFTLAHVKFSPPFVWPAQIAEAFVFGLAYAYMYQRTGSLLGCSLAHGFSNTIYVIMLLLKYAT